MSITRDNPYYYSFAEYCNNTFGRRLYRVALDAGFTCPHRDAGTGEGGCIFRSDAGSGEFSLDFHGQELTMDDIESVLGTRAKREGEPLVRPLDFGEYTDTVCGCLERLSPEIVVHRLTGDCDKDSLVAPLWSLEKGKVINAIRHKMKERR